MVGSQIEEQRGWNKYLGVWTNNFFYFLSNPLILMGFPLFPWESALRGWEWDACELARSTVVLANWHFVLLFQHNFRAGLQVYIVEGENRRLQGRQEPIGKAYCTDVPWFHAHSVLQTARDEPTALVISHGPFVCLCVLPSLPSSIFLSFPQQVILFYRNIKS